MHIPTLILRCGAAAFLSVNGASLGEAGPNAVLSMPVAPDGVYYLCAMPLEKGYCACARKIELNEGAISCAGDGISALCWPGGAIEIMIEMEELELNKAYEPASTISQHRIGPLTATLFRESGIHIAIENDTDMLFSHTVAPGGWAKMEHARSENGHILYILSKDEKVSRCCCVRLSERIEITYEGEGASFTREGVRVTRIESIESQKGYERKEVFDITTGTRLSEETGFFTRQPNALGCAMDACNALLDAVRLGLEEEIPPLLGGALEGLSIDDLRDFFGQYTCAAQPPSHLGDSILLGLLDDSPVAVAKLFMFECENKDGWRVVNASEI